MTKIFLPLYTLLFLLSTIAFAIENQKLVLAIELDDLSTVQEIIASGDATVDTKLKAPAYSDPGAPLITLAARDGSLKVLKYLIDQNAKLDAKTPANETALMLASFFPDEIGNPSSGYKKHIEAAEMLVAAGADLENDLGFYHPLSYAAYAVHPKITELLLKNGADVNAGLRTGACAVKTPLMMAAMTGDEESALLLLDHGANAKIIFGDDKDALYYAKKYNNQDIAKYVECAQSLQPGENFKTVCRK